jgi:hypothetical protein
LRLLLLQKRRRARKRERERLHNARVEEDWEG